MLVGEPRPPWIVQTGNDRLTYSFHVVQTEPGSGNASTRRQDDEYASSAPNVVRRAFEYALARRRHGRAEDVGIKRDESGNRLAADRLGGSASNEMATADI
jgi:hypothetical protein